MSDELIMALEQARYGDPMLSHAVLRAIGWCWEPFGCPGNGLWRTPDGGPYEGPLPLVTERTEAARTLIPKRLFVATRQNRTGHWTVELFTHPLLRESDFQNPIIRAKARTLALALCSATLKARVR